jgi:hypothetical protein
MSETHEGRKKEETKANVLLKYLTGKQLVEKSAVDGGGVRPPPPPPPPKEGRGIESLNGVGGVGWGSGYGRGGGKVQ